MIDELEKELHAALRPVDPEDGFADRVLARIEREGNEAVPTRRNSYTRVPRLQRWSLALAASVAVIATFVGTHLWQERREREAGIQAREQLIEALRVTSQKLDLAYESVNPKPGADDEGSGA